MRKDWIKDIIVGIGSLFAWTSSEDVFRWAQVPSLLFTGTRKGKFASWGKYSVMRYKPLLLHGLRYIQVGKHTLFDEGLQLEAYPMADSPHPIIIIGDHCIIRKDAHITAVRRIVIGDNLLTGTNVLITDNAHGDGSRATLDLPPVARKLHSKGEIIIGNNVWIGNNACILGNVHIGDGAVIGANAVVTSDVPAYHIAVGVPAKVLENKGNGSC